MLKKLDPKAANTYDTYKYLPSPLSFAESILAREFCAVLETGNGSNRTKYR